MKNLCGADPTTWNKTEEEPVVEEPKKDLVKPPRVVTEDLRENMAGACDLMEEDYEYYPDKHLYDAIINLKEVLKSLDQVEPNQAV